MLQSDRALIPRSSGRGHPRSGESRSIRRRLAPLMLSFALAITAGCGDSDGGTVMPTATTTVRPTQTAVPSATRTLTPVPTQTTTPTMGLSAAAACDKLVSCRQCMINQRGECLAPEACAARLSADAVRCLSQLNGCDPEALGDCLQFGCSGTDAEGECL